MIKKCMFPVAGYGTRFLPATKVMPKEMLPVLNKPLIQYGVEEALAAGITDIAMVTGRGKRTLEDHFDISYELEHQINGTDKEALLSEIRQLQDNCTFSYTRQKAMRGLGDAILTGEVLIGETEAFGVVLADDLCVNVNGDPVLKQMVDVYNKYKCTVVAIEEVPRDQVSKYGVVAGEMIDDNLISITEMIEKPHPDQAPSNLAIIGRYILTQDIFAILRTTQTGVGSELQLTDALLQQAKDGRALGLKFKGIRHDCGSLHGFVDAINDLYQVHLNS